MQFNVRIPIDLSDKVKHEAINERTTKDSITIAALSYYMEVLDKKRSKTPDGRHSEDAIEKTPPLGRKQPTATKPQKPARQKLS